LTKKRDDVSGRQDFDDDDAKRRVPGKITRHTLKEYPAHAPLKREFFVMSS
jgi:hypothetical protein